MTALDQLLGTPDFEVVKMSCPSRTVFERDIVPLRRPCVFQGGLETWGARNWTFDTFAGASTPIKVRLEEGNLFDCTHVTGRGNIVYTLRREMLLSDFVRQLQSTTPGTPTRYLTEWPLLDHLPTLASDIDYTAPALFPQAFSSPVRLYMGPAGSFTPLHFDHAPNLTAQIRGRKQWVLLAPDQSSCLYPFERSSQLSHFSRANTLAKMRDATLFPLLARARGSQVILEEGDLLYVPPGWWHHVLALTASISLNFFWKYPAMLVRQMLETPTRRLRGQKRASDVTISGPVAKELVRQLFLRGALYRILHAGLFDRFGEIN